MNHFLKALVIAALAATYFVEYGLGKYSYVPMCSTINSWLIVFSILHTLGQPMADDEEAAAMPMKRGQFAEAPGMPKMCQ